MNIKKLCQLEINNINNSILDIDERHVFDLIDELNNCNGIIYFTGVGKNGHIAAITASTFASIGIKSIYLNPVDAVHGDMGNIETEDIIVNISKSGNTKELLNFLYYLNNIDKKIKIISIHSNLDGQTAKLANINVYIPNIKEIDKFNMVPTTSLVTYTIFLQSIGVHISNLRNFNLQQFKKNHPGGSIGEQLKNE